MATARTIRALEQLASRPGTSHEGILARRKLEELRKKRLQPEPSVHRVAEVWTCPCGSRSPVGDQCRNNAEHERIRQQIQNKFKKGDRVYYNYWAYEPNCTATVIGYMKQPDGNNWAWIRLRFDHLKSGYRSVPIHSDKGWHLSHEPLPLWEAYRLIKPK